MMGEVPSRCAFSAAEIFCKVFIGLVFGAISAGPALAQSTTPQPSFDCAKATARIERMICTDPELAQWDGRMGEAYKQKYAGLVGNDRRALIEDQRRWIASRNAKCNQTELPEAKPCILQFTKARFSVLQQQAAEPLQLVAPSMVPSEQAKSAPLPMSVIGTIQDAVAADQRGDYATEFRIFHSLAAQGDSYAQFRLGEMYFAGTGVPQDDKEAARWYHLAAEQGYAKAQFELGRAHELGSGVPPDSKEAAKWYRLAAEQGDAEAQCELGFMYSFGVDVPKDYKEGAKWYRLAAEQGNADAQAYLAGNYLFGLGVPQDFVAAYMWLNLAVAQGHVGMADRRDEIARRLTPAQLAEAQKLAREWRPKTANASPAEITPRPPLPKEPESGATSGTAFFVSNDGKALTNAHVVERCQQVNMSGDGQNGTAQVLAQDDKNDLALLATDLHPAQFANWRLSVRQGEDVVVYGFPLTGVLAAGGNVATGNVTALAGLGDDSRFLQISAPVQPGNSGGPLLDRSGSVVGIVVAKLNALGIASETGDIPQNVNFAIKASVAAAFLDAQRVVHPEGQDTASLSTPDLSERARAFTAQVVCLR